jgi:hypothetical protein
MSEEEVSAERADTAEGQPLCLRCLKPIDPPLDYCVHCGGATGQFTEYIPFVNISWYTDACKIMWRKAWIEPGVPFFQRLVCMIIIVPYVPIVAVACLLLWPFTHRRKKLDAD